MVDLPLATLVGQLVVGGYDGADAPSPRFLRALASGERGGAILFRRNVPDVETAWVHASAITRAAPPGLPPFISVDQEGGRVARLGAPVLALPPMRALAALGDAGLVRRVAAALGGQLAALGFDLDFAPVLDVDTNPDNPVIGDRAFGATPDAVVAYALPFAAGLADAGVLACAKHFPGHGDTHVDSHLALPTIGHDRARLEAIELAPFRAAARALVPTMMTAHVVCTALDATVPATLSRAIVTDLLRGEIGYRGVLFSDDLEMRAVADLAPPVETAVAAVAAGCDVVLVCRDEDAQDAVHAALVREAERSAAFRERAGEAAARALAARRAHPPRPAPTREALRDVLASARVGEVAAELAARLGAGS